MDKNSTCLLLLLSRWEDTICKVLGAREALSDRVSLVAQTVKNPPAMEETEFYAWVRKIPWRKACQHSLVFLPGEPHGQKSLADYSP